MVDDVDLRDDPDDRAVVEPETSVDALARIFPSANAAVVVDHGAVVGIVTKIDVIDHLAKRVAR